MLVCLAVGFVSNPDKGGIKQPHQGRQHPFLRHHHLPGIAFDPQVKVILPPDNRQYMAKFYHLVKLGRTAQLGPEGVIDVLLAPFLVNSRSLQVALVVFTDPDIGPGGRDFQPLYMLERLLSGQQPAVWAGIVYLLAPLPP